MPAFYSNSSKQTFQVKLLERCFWKLPQYFCIWYSYNKVAMGFYGFEIFFQEKTVHHSRWKAHKVIEDIQKNYGV